MADTDPIGRLMEKGVQIPHPQSVYVSPEVNPDRIAPGVTIHPGCRITGADTCIMSGCIIGREGPATIEDCRLGRGVELKGGYFKASVFLDNASMGAGAHVREACLLEEESGGAHTVGLKQTILMPFVSWAALSTCATASSPAGPAAGTTARSAAPTSTSTIPPSRTRPRRL